MAYFIDDDARAEAALKLITQAVQAGALNGKGEWWSYRDPETSGQCLGKFLGAAAKSLADELKKL
ncbi:hypothetical protein G3N96_32480 [Burkholderia sp. Se-20373]|uniref:hypothetical protein n=1 Tax=Burkholderia sp. Se-20373 TaxID=2703898 RepID=UPI001981F099|nr:hypothetical protein [Burkholderia sp. Se-20373]MBN3750101.1 hypothetical protein [Burkholderia sp. Se-20373]